MNGQANEEPRNGEEEIGPVRYVVKYEFDGSSHYGAIQIKDGDRLHLETQLGSKTATTNPKSDVTGDGPASGVRRKARFNRSAFELMALLRR